MSTIIDFKKKQALARHIAKKLEDNFNFDVAAARRVADAVGTDPDDSGTGVTATVAGGA